MNYSRIDTSNGVPLICLYIPAEDKKLRLGHVENVPALTLTSLTMDYSRNLSCRAL